MSAGRRKDLRIGCCGFAEAQMKYFADFDLLEVQKTFYQPPQKKTVQRWRDSAPQNFVFTLKAWQLITHEPSSPTYRRMKKDVPESKEHLYGDFRATADVLNAWQTTREIAEILRAEIVVFQSPSSFSDSRDNRGHMARFFEKIDRSGLRLVWEPRGWDREEAAAVCRDLDLVRAVDPFTDPPPETGMLYLRLHGIEGYRSRYEEDHLEQLADWCRGRESYVLFNNYAMKDDALRFSDVAQKG